jgi:hypothetical protein
MQTHTHTRARAHTHSRIQYFVLGGAHFNELEKNYELFGLFVWERHLVHHTKNDDFFSLHTLKALQFHHISSLYPIFLQNLHNNLSTVQNNTLKKITVGDLGDTRPLGSATAHTHTHTHTNVIVVMPRSSPSHTESSLNLTKNNKLSFTR